MLCNDDVTPLRNQKMRPSHHRLMPKRVPFGAACLLTLTFLCASPGVGAPPAPSFTQINQPGFGDRRNSYSWSMRWFNGNLYVGTNREFPCVEQATIAFYYPTIPGIYNTNPTPGVTCPADPSDLDLRAEIWRYTPGTRTWVRVYQSPTQPNPTPGKPNIARD